MEETSNLSLPYILPSQAQKHVTHNEALRALDALVHLAVVSRGVASPPAAPDEGSRYIVDGASSGDWIGHETEIAAWQDGAWAFYQPKPGWIAVVLDEDVVCFWNGESWEQLQGGTPESLDGVTLQNVLLAGIGTVADSTNEFSAKLGNALWTARPSAEGGTGDLRYKMNKEGSANVLSLLMQTAYSGRAELGLIGADDLSLKVSADGATWREALKVDRATAAVSLPHTNLLSDYCLSLYTDSGRFAGAGVNAIAIGSFALPAYLTRYNSATVTGLAKFLNNNTDYGGAAGTLNASVKSLIDMIRDSSYRRYGVEFWVAEFTHGSGVASPLSHLSQNWYLSLMTNQTLRAPNMTFHTYIRAIDADILIRRSVGQTLIVNGAALSDHAVISPAQDWVSLTVRDSVSLRQSYGYMPMTLNVHVRTAGQRYQLACPALMGGLTTVDDNVGVVAATGSWPS